MSRADWEAYSKLSSREKAKLRCVHFTGTVTSNVCKAGVRYDSVNPLPCIAVQGMETAECPLRVFPTDEELDEADRRVDLMIENMGKARAIIVEHIKANGDEKKSARGEVACPVCGAPLLYRYAGNYNKHIHASCSTQGCVRWME